MIAKSDPVYLRLPGSSSWEWWSRASEAGSYGPSAAPRSTDRALYGMASAECDSMPVWVNSPEPAIIEQVLGLELERLGMKQPAGGGRHLDWRLVGSDGPRKLVHAVSVPGMLDPLAREPMAQWAGFFPATLYFHPPERSIVLWRELERWMVGFEHGGVWVHFQNLGANELEPEILNEVHCLQLELEGRKMIGPVDLLVIWADETTVRAAFRDEARRVLGLPVQVSARPNPSTSGTDGWSFLPASIAAERQRQANVRRWVRLGLASASVFLLLMGAGLADLMFAKTRNTQLQREIERLEPGATVVREAKERWEAIEPALDVHRYPVELFHQVASLFPETGLRMTHFEIREDGQIIVKAEASSVPVAIGFKADLENAASLNDYEWNIPAPEIEGDTAAFVAFGTYRFSPAPPNEG